MKPYFETENGKLYHGDCLEVMSQLESESVDMVLTDPPYGTTSCKWDSIVPLDKMWEQLKRLIKTNVAIVMTASQPFTTKLINSNMDEFKYCWIWEKSKSSGFAHAKNMPLKNYDDVVVFSAGQTGHVSQCKKRVNYNPQGIVYSPRITVNSKDRSDDESTFSNRPSHKDAYTQEYTNYPKQVIRFNSVHKAVHPTQKPVALMEYLIRTYTKKTETVLDFTLGSGTTAIACEEIDRKWIGIEQDEKYCEIAAKRIEQSTAQLKLPGF